MNRFGSNPIHANLTLYEVLPLQGFSEARRAGSFFNFLFTDPPHRKPRRGRRQSSYLKDRVETIPVILPEYYDFHGKCSKNLNAQLEFKPPPLRIPPNAIQPEQVIRHHRNKRRGSRAGQALSPSSSYQCFVFQIIVKGILWSRYNGNFIISF